ncbi:lamin tail domain-containing protein [Pseudoalteromonas sp. BZB3]|uniref:lamin tail domain-containing protein n=1 Tax=Pseudoalteromonas sp. BZB3 TaxID=3136670 RepID=UPI0032C48C0D
MSNFTLDDLEKAQSLVFSKDKLRTWQQLSELLTAQLDTVKKEPDPFSTWWNTNFALFSSVQVQISAVNAGFASFEDEYIEISNLGPSIIDLSGWRLNAGSEGQDYDFNKHTLLFPQDVIRVYTNRENAYSFDSRRPILNNKGDTVSLYDNQSNLVSCYAYGRDAHHDVGITHIFFDGNDPKKESDEYIEIGNLGNHIIDLSLWEITSNGRQRFQFPVGSKLMPHSELRVYTNQINESTGGFSFNSNRAIWNNNGDVGRLFDYQKVLVSEYAYA